MQHRPQLRIDYTGLGVGEIAEVDRDVAFMADPLRLPPQIRVGLEQDVVVDAADIHGEAQLAGNLGDPVVFGIGMKFAHGADEVRARGIAVVPVPFEHGGELDRCEDRILPELARDTTGMAVGAVHAAEAVAQIAADAGNDAGRQTGFEQRRPLFDMGFDVAADPGGIEMRLAGLQGGRVETEIVDVVGEAPPRGPTV